MFRGDSDYQCTHCSADVFGGLIGKWGMRVGTRGKLGKVGEDRMG